MISEIVLKLTHIKSFLKIVSLPPPPPDRILMNLSKLNKPKTKDFRLFLFYFIPLSRLMFAFIV